MKNIKKIAEEILAGVIDVSKDAKDIVNVIDKLKSKIVEKDLGNSEIESILNGKLGRFGITFESGFGESADPNLAQLGVVNSSVANNGFILITYNNYFWESFKEKDKQTWNSFLKSIKSLIQQEAFDKEIKELEKDRDKAEDEAENEEEE